MNKVTIKIIDNDHNIKIAKSNFDSVFLTYRGEYQAGDKILVQVTKVPCYLVVRLEDSFESCLLYLTKPEMVFTIPFADQARVYSDKAFRGGKHFLWARVARDYEISRLQNLAYNPYFQAEQTGIFPAISSTVVANNIRFAARNAIDGYFDSSEHGSYPFTSWSNGQQQDGQLIIDFGREIETDSVIFYLRADFPHDSWWQEVSLHFNENDVESFTLKRTGMPQWFTFSPRQTTKIILTNLLKADEPAAFTALTQIEILGRST